MSVYHKRKYEDPTRWMSYYHQIDEVESRQPRSVLEIGKGSGLVSTVLRSRGYEVRTVDIDKDLTPDIVGDVRNIPVKDGVADLVLCAEVLEHLPFKDFDTALGEIRRVTRRWAVISLPYWGWVFWFGLKLPLLPKIDLFWKMTGMLRHKEGGDHYWEIGKRGFPLKRIEKHFRDAGFTIRKSYIGSDAPYHYFFVLEK